MRPCSIACPDTDGFQPHSGRGDGNARTLLGKVRPRACGTGPRRLRLRRRNVRRTAPAYRSRYLDFSAKPSEKAGTVPPLGEPTRRAHEELGYERRVDQLGEEHVVSPWVARAPTVRKSTLVSAHPKQELKSMNPIRNKVRHRRHRVSRVSRHTDTTVGRSPSKRDKPRSRTLDSPSTTSMGSPTTPAHRVPSSQCRRY